MYVRSFQLSDYLPITQLLSETLSEECCDETMKALSNQLSWDCDLVLVAEDENGQIAGTIIGTIDGDEGFYYRLAVKPSMRRQGYGKALIKSLHQRFELRNVRKIKASVDAHNGPVARWFESMGYTVEHMTESSRKLSIVTG